MNMWFHLFLNSEGIYCFLTNDSKRGKLGVGTRLEQRRLVGGGSFDPTLNASVGKERSQRWLPVLGGSLGGHVAIEKDREPLLIIFHMQTGYAKGPDFEDSNFCL